MNDNFKNERNNFFLNGGKKKRKKWVVHKRSTNKMWNCELWYTLKSLFLEKVFLRWTAPFSQRFNTLHKVWRKFIKKCYFFESNYFCLRNLSAKVLFYTPGIVFFDTSKTKDFNFIEERGKHTLTYITFKINRFNTF